MSASLVIIDQPWAERALNAALARPVPPQQLLFFGPPGCGKRAAAFELAWRIMDPEGKHDRRAAAVDLIEVRASGAQIRLEELDPALAAIAARPQVLERRVLIIEGAERLRAQEGSSRLLKPLEEPPERSHVILITERPGDLLPTIRSRCLPVPFRTPGAARITERLVEQGMDPDEAHERARADGPAALGADPFTRRMTALGRELGRAALSGNAGPRELVARVESEIEAAAAADPSDELRALQREAAEKEGKRGARTAEKRADDQRKRELRRRSTDGWRAVLAAGAGVVADVIAMRLGATSAARVPDAAAPLAERLEGVSSARLEALLSDFERAVADLAFNPEIPLQAEALVTRIVRTARGRGDSGAPRGRLSI